ncbi:MAG: HtaA domain-containing protein [Patulibacter sp.]|nr:HtaA domain-containing protein [Patulibacter sp.]
MLSPVPRRSTRSLLVPAALTLVAGLAAGGAASPATAADFGAGSVSLTNGSTGLKGQGVRWSASSPVKLRNGRSRAVLPVESGAVTTTATLGLKGTVRLTKGKRRVTLTGLQVRLGKRSTVTGEVDGGQRRTIGRLSMPAKRLKLDRDAATASASNARLKLTTSTARTVRKRLELRRTPTGNVATVAVTGHVKDAPAPSSCSAAYCATGLGAEPPVLDRPSGAVDVRSASLVWTPLDSFVRYINTGEGTSVSGGATDGPREVLPGSSSAFVYRFGFPFQRGWFDAATGTAATTFRGKVAFRFKTHTIDMSAADPEIEINGGKSRVIFRMDGKDGTQLGGTRGVLIDLDLGKAAATAVSPDGKTHSYVGVPGTIPAKAGSSVFAGFYAPGERFGSVTLSFTTG